MIPIDESLDQQYHVVISSQGHDMRSESCELAVTFHAQLFGTIQLDLYESNLLLPDKHIGRTEIRLKSLEGMPETFTSYYEVWDKKLSTGASSVVGRRTAGVNNMGALQATISYTYQFILKSSIEGNGDLGNPENLLPRRLVEMRESDTPTGSTNLLTQEQQATEFRRHLQFQRDRKSAGIKFCKYESDRMTANEDTMYDSESDSDEDGLSALARPLTMRKKKSEDMYDGGKSSNKPVSRWRSFIEPAKSDSDSTSFKAFQSSNASNMENGTKDIMDVLDEELTGGPSDSWAVNKDTNEILRTIRKMMTAFGQGFELSNLQVLSGIAVLDKFYGELPRERTRKLVDDLSKIELASYFWKFSVASYGWKGLNFLGKGNGYFSDAMRSHSDALSVIEHLSIPKDDLLAYEFQQTEAFRPSYYIALDRRTNSVVLCIRGTMSAFDTMTDLVCEYEPWRGGLIHKGIKSSAMWFFRHVAPQLVAYSNEHSTSALYIVGHSLGAATAAILTIMLVDYLDEFRRDTNDKFVLKCFGYAPACCLSLELSEKYKEYIQSFVFADDIVSKLSYGSMMDLKELIIASAEAAEELGTSRVLWAGNFEKEKWKNAFERIAECRRRSLESMANPRLYVAGTVYQFWLDPIPNNETRIVIEESDTKEVSKEVVVQKSIILDHLPTNFDVAFRRAREAVMMSGSKKVSVGVLDGGICKGNATFSPKTEDSNEHWEGKRSPTADAIWDAVANLGLRETSKKNGGEGNLLESGIKR
ncbi:hypothetical protein DFQ28_006748 [Apophysomyces sp. BC1034]|nr:hypothetical protein DFQ30_002140 [Apophysomyces sp. BC1015]KAG0176870.1 hypothetical protein DFQ29_005542 [Apophysomyces sp. BC1021]KAG0187179.1 hypothetical protein DFQ28_006748 [Apophysomyces sp. BC1034]